jgi:hypothetical protein
MISLIQLLKEVEIQKNKWTPIPEDELDDYKNEIFTLISNAYSPLGGHPNYSSPNDITKGERDANYNALDLDDDPDIDALLVSKTKPTGTKFTALGHDNSQDAKSKVINHQANLLKQPGYYIEVSGKILDILVSKGVEPVNNETTVKQVLKGKNIEWLGDGKYKREINGKEYTKSLIGKPQI